MPPSTNHPALVAYLANHPESCTQALQAARDLPLLDLQVLQPIPPPSLRFLADDQITALQPDLAWRIRLGRQQGLLLVDAVEHFEPARVWSWPRLRAGARLQVRCPTWMLVYSLRPSVLAAIEHAFTHQHELMPILFGPEPIRFDPEPAHRQRPDPSSAPAHPISPACRLVT